MPALFTLLGADGSIQLSIPLLSGILTIWVFSITATIMIVRRVQGWDKVETLDKKINGDPDEKADSDKRMGMDLLQKQQAEVLAYWVGQLKAVMRGANIPTGLSDPKALEVHVKGMVQRGELSIGKPPSTTRTKVASYDETCVHEFRAEMEERSSMNPVSPHDRRSSEPGPLPPPFVKRALPVPTRHKDGRLVTERNGAAREDDEDEGKGRG